MRLQEKLTKIYSRAGGPGVSKQDLKWLDERLKAFLEDEKWQLDTSNLS